MRSTTTPEFGDRSTPWPLIAGAIGVALVLRIPAWDAPLGNDEAGSAIVGAAWLSGVDGAAGSYGAYWLDRPPLLPLVYGTADLLGGATGVRALGAIAAAALVTLCAIVAGRLAGTRAAGCAAWIAAPLVSAGTLAGDHTYGELLAGTTVAGSILALLVGREGRPRMLVLAAAGLLAVAAALVKQSAFDALAVGLVIVATTAWRAGPTGRHAAAAWVTGVAAGVGALAAWAAWAPGGIPAAWDAIVGFRLDVLLGTETAVADPAGTPSITQLAVPALASGLALALVAAVWVVVRDLVGASRLVLGAWLGAAILGVLGGGYYWPHYLLQLAAPAAIGAGIWLAGRGALVRQVLLAGGVAIGVAGWALAHEMPHSGRFDDDARRVGTFVAERAAEGDRIEVLYARPGVVHASGLRSTSPYLWRSMYALRADARDGVAERLASQRPPEWVVRWNEPRDFDLDRGGEVSSLVRERYELVATVRERQVLRLRVR